MADFKYRRLRGRGRRVNGLFAVSAPINQLWLGPDHLLSVDRIWVNEEFKRFYFRDIQGIIVQQTRMRRAWALTFLSLAIICEFILFLIAYANKPRTLEGWIIAGGIIAGVWIIPILVNWLRGPTCKCNVVTAVQSEVLPALNRVPKARRILAILNPLIRDAQQYIVPRPAAFAAAQAASQSAYSPGFASAPKPPPLLRKENGIIHGLFYGLMLIGSGTGLYAVLNTAWHINLVIGWLLILSIIALGIACMVRQRSSTLPALPQRLTIASVVVTMAEVFIDLTFYYARIGTLITAGTNRVRTAAAAPKITSSPLYHGYGITINSVELALALAGIAALAVYWTQRTVPPPIPSSTDPTPAE
jgi:hypothetical protein